MEQGHMQFSIIWRGKKFVFEMNPLATLKDLGCELQKKTNVKTDTMRLIIPVDKTSRLLYPFSDEHSCLSLEAASILEGKAIRMMGVPQSEVDEILESSKMDLRIAGFEEEEKRIRRRTSSGQHSIRIPQGNYIFSDFRTLHIPGVELNPPPSEALQLMHRLAADKGIVAIMNKHHWRVGIMTEMAPVGYVGISPKCILGFNKNHGEEISLRLRTDDLRGFRKYQSIKKTLLHELAHMVHSEHDAKFYALDRQLNEEAAALDWTKSKGYTLSGMDGSRGDDGDFTVDSSASLSRKLGGQTPGNSDARALSVAAAYNRLATSVGLTAEPMEEADPDDHQEFGYAPIEEEKLDAGNPEKLVHVLIPDGELQEPEPDCHSLNPEESGENVIALEPSPDDSGRLLDTNPLRSRTEAVLRPNLTENTAVQIDFNCEPIVIPNQDHSHAYDSMDIFQSEATSQEPDPDDSAGTIVQTEPDPEDAMQTKEDSAVQHGGEANFEGQDLQRIQESVSILCNRFQNAVQILRSEANPMDITKVLQTLLNIIQNIIEHPNEAKYKRLRKANPVIQKTILNYKAALEILNLVGFMEDMIFNDVGNAEIYLILKQNDPARLWLAKSSLEANVA
ncbi:hypothetical protein Leryth_017074 [Lithospermum erythrorhizon]|nr:hypothetical protein Leryth_017074 [Lithospermum erythrorhizon]